MRKKKSLSVLQTFFIVFSLLIFNSGKGQISASSPVTISGSGSSISIPGLIGSYTLGLNSAQIIPAAGILGTTLYDNGTAWTTSTNLYHDGNLVGIGTTTPFSKCEIYYLGAAPQNPFFPSSTTLTGGLTITQNVLPCNYTDIHGNNVFCNQNPYLLIRDQQNSTTTYTTGLVFTSYHTLGINTATPTASLDVRNSYQNVPVAVFADGTGSTPHQLSLYPNLSAGTKNPIVQSNDMGLIFTDNGGTSGADNGMGLVIGPQTADATKAGIRITWWGDVAIGGANLHENSNGYKLAVGGNLGVKGTIYVENTSDAWADTVFDQNYKLMSLADLEKYVKENRHLPDVQSACEVEEHGVNVVKDEAAILKNLEEMSLHLIALQKENALLKARLDALESKK